MTIFIFKNFLQFTSTITVFLILGNAAFILMLFEIILGPLFIISKTWLIISLFIGATFILTLIYFFRKLDILASASEKRSKLMAGLFLYIFLIATSFLYAPAIAYTIFFGEKYDSHIYVPGLTKSKPFSHTKYIYRLGNWKDYSSPCYRILSAHLSNKFFWSSVCIPEKTFLLVLGKDFVPVTGKQSFFGKTISSVGTDNNQWQVNRQELDRFWDKD